METEQITPDSDQELKQNILNTVTPLSKYLAMMLFIILPFVGFFVGYKYAPEKIVEVEKVVVKEVEIIKEVEEQFDISTWQRFINTKYNYSFLYPSDQYKIRTLCGGMGMLVEEYPPAEVCNNIEVRDPHLSMNDARGGIKISVHHHSNDGFSRAENLEEFVNHALSKAELFDGGIKKNIINNKDVFEAVFSGGLYSTMTLDVHDSFGSYECKWKVAYMPLSDDSHLRIIHPLETCVRLGGAYENARYSSETIQQLKLYEKIISTLETTSLEKYE